MALSVFYNEFRLVTHRDIINSHYVRSVVSCENS
jgi:hypothetical protein